MRHKQHNTPYQVVWELTLKCNLHCIHCGSTAGTLRPDELSTKEALNLCKDLAELNSQEICLMGGEPFLRKDWVQLGGEIKNYGMKLLFISNGYAITQQIISQLKRLQPYAVATSLDGGTTTTHDHIRGTSGSFKKVMDFLASCKSADLPTTVITTVNKLNINELPGIKDIIQGQQIAWQIQVATPTGRFPRRFALNKEEYYAVALFISSLQKKYSRKELPVIGAHCFGYHSLSLPDLGLSSTWQGCPAGTSILSVKSNGDVIGCLAMPVVYIEGNIRTRSIIDIWTSPDSFAYNKQFSHEALGENCRSCCYGDSCKGGCMGMSTAFTGQPHNTRYCFYKIEQEFPIKTKEESEPHETDDVTTKTT